MDRSRGRLDCNLLPSYGRHISHVVLHQSFRCYVSAKSAVAGLSEVGGVGWRRVWHAFDLTIVAAHQKEVRRQYIEGGDDVNDSQ